MTAKHFSGKKTVRIDLFGIGELELGVSYKGYADPGCFSGKPDNWYPPESDLEIEYESAVIHASGERVQIHPDALQFMELTDAAVAQVENQIRAATSNQGEGSCS